MITHRKRPRLHGPRVFGFIAILAVLIPGFSQQRELYGERLAIVRKSLVERGITLRLHGEEGFLEAARALRSTAELDAIKDLLPTSLIIENNTRRAIVYVTLVTEVVKGSGDVVYRVNMTGDIANRDQYARLEPGQSRLLTADAFVNDAMLRHRPLDTTLKFLTSQNDQMLYYQRVHAVRSMVTVPDSIVLEDGEVLGEDRYGIVAHEEAERLAIEKLSNTFREMSGGGRSREEMIAFFEAKSKQGAPIFHGQTFDHHPAAEEWSALTFFALLKTPKTNEQVLETMRGMREAMEARPHLFRSGANR